MMTDDLSDFGDLEIPDEDAEKLRTVGDVAGYLEKKGKGQSEIQL